MTKFKNFLIAVIAAMILVFACIMPVTVTFASGGAEEPTDPPQTPQITYEDLYYFSDNEKCSQRFGEYVATFNNIYSASIQGHLIDWTESNDKTSLEKASTYITQNGLPKIKKSLVIFEVCNEYCLQYYLNYRPEMSEYDHEYADTNNLLYSFFSQLKENKENECKIMFICGFDEARFMSHNAFLDFVDIHVNTALLENFMYNTINRIQSDGRIDNRTIIFDSALSFGMGKDADTGHALSNIYFKNYFFRFFIYAYKKEITNEVNSVFVKNGIKFLFFIDDGEFYDGVEDVIIRDTENDGYTYLNEYLNNEKVCVVGASWKGEDKLEELYTILDFAYRAGGSSADMEFYIFNSQNYPLNFINGYTLREEGNDLGWFEYTLSIIAADFICGNDLTIYDNWDGRCIVTYKPVTFSPNGWFYDFGWNRDSYPKWLEFFSDLFEINIDFVWKL